METFFNNGSMTKKFQILNVHEEFGDVQKMGGVHSLQTDTYPKEKSSMYFLHAEYIKKSIHHSLFSHQGYYYCRAYIYRLQKRWLVHGLGVIHISADAGNFC